MSALATPSSSSSADDPGSARSRGLGWVVTQFVLIAAVILAGFVSPDWPDSVQGALSTVGTVLAIAGGGFAVWAARTLGRSLTPFPKPVPAGLATTGPFAVVRHPIYTGGIAFFLGYSLWATIPALVLTFALAILWAGKVRVEERHLGETYEGYRDYAQRVRWRIVPFVY
jgi:protein-S-isoprenylcysteine O-methyltransferase Ste14